RHRARNPDTTARAQKPPAITRDSATEPQWPCAVGEIGLPRINFVRNFDSLFYLGRRTVPSRQQCLHPLRRHPPLGDKAVSGQKTLQRRVGDAILVDVVAPRDGSEPL